MKLFELNNQTFGSNIFKEQDLPLDFSEVINYRFVKEDTEEGISEHYQIIFFYGDALGFNIDSFNMTILQEDLQNNIPVAYASVNVLDERTEEVIDTIIYTIRFDSKTEEFKHLKDFILANITSTQKIVLSDLY